MTVVVVHKFASGISDDANAALVRPSNWNDTHNLTGAANQLLGFDGSGNATEVDPSTVGASMPFDDVQPNAPGSVGVYAGQDEANSNIKIEIVAPANGDAYIDFTNPSADFVSRLLVDTSDGSTTLQSGGDIELDAGTGGNAAVLAGYSPSSDSGFASLIGGSGPGGGYGAAITAYGTYHSGVGGYIYARAGLGKGTEAGGDCKFFGGYSPGPGGNVTFIGGESYGAYSGGNVELQGGDSSAGTGGYIKAKGASPGYGGQCIINAGQATGGSSYGGAYGSMSGGYASGDGGHGHFTGGYSTHQYGGGFYFHGGPVSAAATSSGVAGAIGLYGGDSYGAAKGGAVLIYGGYSDSGAGGNLVFRGGYGSPAGNILLLNLPTSAAGLPTGAIWNNSGVLNIA